MERACVSGEMPLLVAAEILNCSEGEASRAISAARYDADMAVNSANWKMEDSIVEMVPRELFFELRDLGRARQTKNDEWQAGLEKLVEAFIAFQDEFFEIGPGRKFIVKDFHRKWIKALIYGWLTGGKQKILSPPRHGKSELLIRLCVWAICLDFTIRIMWMSSNKDVSGIMMAAVKDHLEHNDALIRSVLPPGQIFRPERLSGKPWHTSEIKIVQMDIIGQKSSTLITLGLRSDVLSRDVDILITDDIEDYDSTREPAGRQYGRQKFAEVGTRKEEWTTWWDIGSRQHPEDLSHTLSDSASAQSWDIITESAHQDCQLDPEIIEGHDENGCVLFPEVRSYRWLMEKKAEMDDLGLPGAYEMRYLNAPRPTSGLVFRVETIRELCLDRSRDLGTSGLPVGRLIGGLDPAARGTQAGFGWLWTPNMLYMVDLETQEAGGFEGALRLFSQWDVAYGFKDWKYEDNSQQVEFFADPRLKKLSLDRGINVKPYHTGKNKQDPELGLSAMAPFYHKGRVNLPYGTVDARRKVNLFLRQLENWTTEGTRRKSKTDIKMASWFPFGTILKWNQELSPISLVAGAEESYPGVSDFGNVGWGQTNYPGGS